MANVLKNISNGEAAYLLKVERAQLEQQRAGQLRIIRDAQEALDVLDQRLREVDAGERVLSGHG